jgi:hypothetical protein
MAHHTRQSLRPGLECLEGRDLLSVTVAPAVDQGSRNQTVATSVAMSAALASSVPYQGTQPTPAELARERFRAVFSGPFTTGKPLFFDQTSRTVIRGAGGSNFFAHGNMQFLIVTPRDPNSPLVGTATMQDRNLNTAGVLIVDLTASRNDFDSQGRPTHLTWSFTPFAGSGSFTAGAFSLSSGQGTLDIRYRPGGRTSAPGVTSLGNATLIFKGTVFTPGTTNPLANANLQASHHQAQPF